MNGQSVKLGFAFQEEYERFLWPRTGSAYVYSGCIRRASKVLGEFIEPAVLSSLADVDRISGRIRPEIKAKRSFNSIRCALRAYVAMVNSNFESRFENYSAPLTPDANDLADCPELGRTRVQVFRIIRDTNASREIKALYEYRCQVCGETLEIGPGLYYAEAHHIRPLGGDHGGRDKRENMICVCPNHHAQLDYFARTLNVSELRLKEHDISSESIDYHNRMVRLRMARASDAGPHE